MNIQFMKITGNIKDAGKAFFLRYFFSFPETLSDYERANYVAFNYLYLFCLFGHIAFIGSIPPNQIEMYKYLDKKNIWKDMEEKAD